MSNICRCRWFLQMSTRYGRHLCTPLRQGVMVIICLFCYLFQIHKVSPFTVQKSIPSAFCTFSKNRLQTNLRVTDLVTNLGTKNCGSALISTIWAYHIIITHSFNQEYLLSKYRDYCIMNVSQPRIKEVFLLRELAFIFFYCTNSIILQLVTIRKSTMKRISYRQ